MSHHHGVHGIFAAVMYGHQRSAVRPRTYRHPRVSVAVADEPMPVTIDGMSDNALRPRTLDRMIGQETLKPLLRRIIDAAKATGEPLDHLLMVGSSGTGKTTLALIVATELGRTAYMLKAPVTLATFEQLREKMVDGDVLIIDEIHQQISGDRRGITQAADPETFFHVMEDHRLATAHGMLDFPRITVIGATTDSGLLPEPFLNRFPLQPRLAPYTLYDMTRIVKVGAEAIGLQTFETAAQTLAGACRATPRVANNYVKNARALSADGWITESLAVEVVTVLNSTTLDGLTLDMQRMLTFLLSSRREDRAGNVVHQASVNTVATALGKSRDTKVVALYVEPYLIERGLVQVTHGGRQLTPAGIARAVEL